MGGANELVLHGETAVQGLSPRGRGKLRFSTGNNAPTGSIPAWAGQTPAVDVRQPLDVVYPRVGGANRLRGVAWSGKAGLSPRGRGKPLIPLFYQLLVRSIPAWAGQTWRCSRFRPSLGVYPRVGGANAGVLCLICRYPGSLGQWYPRSLGHPERE